MKKENKPAVVIDTNLFISGIIIKRPTPPYQLLQAWRSHAYDLYTSVSLIDELELVFQREWIAKKYHISPEEVATFLRELHNSITLVTPVPLSDLPVHSRDKKDDKLLACALGGTCDYLITGDADLLVLNGRTELGSLQIIEAAKFLKMVT